MSRIKYGIDLGTTNSAIAVIEKGESVIVKSELQKDTLPSCVAFSKRKTISVGDKAFNQLQKDKLIALKKGKSGESNTFVEFKRLMGSDKKSHSTFMEADYMSEDFSAEVLKKLKSFTQEDNFRSVVITIPAMFNDNQKAASKKAAELAGFSQVELLQEPIAAAMAFGMDEKTKDGQILIFDFGGGTFDVCLVNIEDGIMQVKDTGGDNWLGGKNLDQAIVDEIMMPYLKENYSIESYINDESKNSLLKEALKVEAEKIKINLSFSDSYDIVSDIGDYPEDDNGEEIEFDFTVTNKKLKSVLAPIFQKAVDITKELLTKNNLNGKTIADLILVGGPTFSPILRELLEDQVCNPNTKVDPMTVVARGAAIYAMQFDVDETIQEEVKDKTKIQLELSYESQSVEEEEMLVVKLNKSKTDGDIPEKLFTVVKRTDGGWESDKSELSETGDIIELKLRPGKPNIFEVSLTSESGDFFECEPNELTIIQGVKSGNATLAMNYGVELLGENGKANFYCIPGLEKNQTMPASGEKSGLRTQKDIRPGSNDEINISIYQGTEAADDTRASNQIWVATVKLTGNDISRLLPKNTEVSLFLEIVRDGVYKLSIDIPFLNDTIDLPFDVSHKQKGEDDLWFDQQFKSLESEIKAFEESNDNYDSARIDKIRSNVAEIKKEYEARKSDDDTRMQTRDNLRKQFAEFDNIENESSWPSAEKSLKEAYYRLDENLKGSTNSQFTGSLDRFKTQMEKVIAKKNVKDAKELEDDIRAMNFAVVEDKHGVELWISIIQNMNKSFDSQVWSDKAKARSLLSSAMSEAVSNPNKDRIRNFVIQLWDLQPDRENGGDDSILKG
ncbi:MAG: Chaperone protein DnaK [Cryomorphaceae bacterium]|nr:MAG: Chaperone protein DnaK [Cryomorphaceae bacterium]